VNFFHNSRFDDLKNVTGRREKTGQLFQSPAGCRDATIFLCLSAPSSQVGIVCNHLSLFGQHHPDMLRIGM